MCVLAQASSACADMDFCEWKYDCRECSKLTANRECVSRDFCVWDQGTLPKYPITSADIAFTVASLLCELYTAFRLLKVIFLPPSLCTIASASLRYVQGYVNDTNRLLAYICCVPPGMKTRNLCVWGHVILGALDIITFDTTTLRV